MNVTSSTNSTLVLVACGWMDVFVINPIHENSALLWPWTPDETVMTNPSCKHLATIAEPTTSVFTIIDGSWFDFFLEFVDPMLVIKAWVVSSCLSWCIQSSLMHTTGVSVFFFNTADLHFPLFCTNLRCSGIIDIIYLCLLRLVCKLYASFLSVDCLISISVPESSVSCSFPCNSFGHGWYSEKVL